MWRCRQMPGSCPQLPGSCQAQWPGGWVQGGAAQQYMYLCTAGHVPLAVYVPLDRLHWLCTAGQAALAGRVCGGQLRGALRACGGWRGHQIHGLRKHHHLAHELMPAGCRPQAQKEV